MPQPRAWFHLRRAIWNCGFQPTQRYPSVILTCCQQPMRTRPTDYEDSRMKRIIKTLVRLMAVLMMGGCAVLTVADAAVSVTATVVKTGVKAAGAVINAVIPD